MMQSHDCCCGYSYNAAMNASESTKRAVHSSFEDTAEHNNNDMESRKSSSSFSIDAILSTHPRREMKKKSEFSNETPPCLKRANDSVSPMSDSICCSSSNRRCYSPICHSPERESTRRSDCISYYRHSDYPKRVNHFGRHIGYEATMVPIEKQAFIPGCAECEGCKIAEIHRIRYGSSSIIPYASETASQRDAIQHGHDERRSKRKRTIFTTEQLDRLENEFQVQQYVVGQERKYLAVELGLNEIQVKVWFQNRRIKWRKQKGSKLQSMSVDMSELEKYRS